MNKKVIVGVLLTTSMVILGTLMLHHPRDFTLESQAAVTYEYGLVETENFDDGPENVSPMYGINTTHGRFNGQFQIVSMGVFPGLQLVSSPAKPLQRTFDIDVTGVDRILFDFSQGATIKTLIIADTNTEIDGQNVVIRDYEILCYNVNKISIYVIDYFDEDNPFLIMDNVRFYACGQVPQSISTVEFDFGPTATSISGMPDLGTLFFGNNANNCIASINGSSSIVNNSIRFMGTNSMYINMKPDYKAVGVTIYAQTTNASGSNRATITIGGKALAVPQIADELEYSFAPTSYLGILKQNNVYANRVDIFRITVRFIIE